MSIHIKNITKRYGTQKALDSVSFSVKKGSITGFIGPNGAGKSTTMKIITGFIPPDEGSVEVNGMDVVKHSLEIRKITGYLPEHNPLYPEMYVKEYLEYVQGLYGMKGQVKKTIELTGLGPEQHKKIAALSKGYKQRVGLAQSIIHNPGVLILDEPTSGLDPNQIIEIRNLISGLGEEKTVMLSTHLMQEVEAICDRVVIIKSGTIAAEGKPNEISYKGEGNSETIIIEFDKTPDTSKILNIDGVLELKKINENKYLVSCKKGSDLRSVLFRFAVDQDLTVLSLVKKERSMEEVFREITN